MSQTLHRYRQQNGRFLPGSKIDPRERLLRYVEVEPKSGCWRWLGHLGFGGYGLISYRGRTMKAHRVAFLLFRGDLPPELDHLCRNRACVNPEHLEPVTRRENVERGDSPISVNMRKAECPRGHPYDGWSRYRGRHCRTCYNGQKMAWQQKSRAHMKPRARLTAAQVREILSTDRAVTHRTLATRYQVSRGTIAGIRAGRSWLHVTEPPRRLTEADVPHIRAAVAHGQTRTSLARQFGVTEGTIRAVVDRRSWRHVG